MQAGLIGVKELVRDDFERLEKIFSEGRRITGLATGYADSTMKPPGLQPSELIILAARPSMGKTALALNIAENVALRQQRAGGHFQPGNVEGIAACCACSPPKRAWTRTSSAPAT